VIVGLAALVFLNVWRIVAAFLAAQNGPVATVGAAMGALVHFSG
jgi:hypothetical protein